MNTSQKAKKLLAEDLNREPSGSRFKSYKRLVLGSKTISCPVRCEGLMFDLEEFTVSLNICQGRRRVETTDLFAWKKYKETVSRSDQTQ